MAAVDCKSIRRNRFGKFYNPCVGKGAVLFTGPDGIRDHKARILDPRVTGIGNISREGTSDLDYILRAAKGCPHPRPKSVKVGEIGWDVFSTREDHVKMLRSGNQIKHGEFRLACELRHTHLYQNPWYPAPRRSNQQITIVSLKKLKDAKLGNQPANIYRKAVPWSQISSSSSKTKRVDKAMIKFAAANTFKKCSQK